LSLFWTSILPRTNPAISRSWQSEVGNGSNPEVRLLLDLSHHTDIHGANGVVGPPLDKIANRAYVAGYPNSPEHLINWIRYPQKVRNPTPMPDMGVTEEDARESRRTCTRCVMRLEAL
jgi:hypothetical protein